ncbi:uncharacterized protein N7515_006584 [Penicillium bovifimosum]|uniref:N-acetyltransferase domain-containing protein n=1 Tax=Penicillium bovifimosum TaxID=126998 RepID=A0A9W9GUZ1_9EURO|nr:uncharacterized protein N7515_006584 [Penicillium bovifimosum]KAJ5130545.1 hypothetical protein N7515_006584 [Penicillium bovifimosum]
MSVNTKVVLFPWDPESDIHRKRLVEQRVECSWHREKVEKEWRDQQVRGDKCIYWIEHAILQDTATSLNAVPRQPTGKAFIPIGHISLDSKNPDAEHIDLDLPSDNVFWIKTFYVSRTIQGKGIGRAAMDEVEAMAVREPLLAKTLMLDTVHQDDQKNEEFARATGGAPKMTNQEWYARRGYRLIKTVPGYYDVLDSKGEVWHIRTVFMRKDIA